MFDFGLENGGYSGLFGCCSSIGLIASKSKAVISCQLWELERPGLLSDPVVDRVRARLTAVGYLGARFTPTRG